MGEQACRRHWFTYYGQVGSSSPECRRCGAPNPRYRPEEDPQRPYEPGETCQTCGVPASECGHIRPESSR